MNDPHVHKPLTELETASNYNLIPTQPTSLTQPNSTSFPDFNRHLAGTTLHLAPTNRLPPYSQPHLHTAGTSYVAHRYTL